MVVQRGFNRCGVKSFCPPQCSAMIHHTSVKMVSVVLLAQQFHTGLKHSRSPCTISECLSCRVCNSSYHHIYTWSTMCVSERMQNSPLPFQAKLQHHWSRTTATNLGCMKAPFGLICLNFLWNFLRDYWTQWLIQHSSSLSFLGYGRSTAFFHLHGNLSVAKSTHNYRGT